MRTPTTTEEKGGTKNNNRERATRDAMTRLTLLPASHGTGTNPTAEEQQAEARKKGTKVDTFSIHNKNKEKSVSDTTLFLSDFTKRAPPRRKPSVEAQSQQRGTN